MIKWICLMLATATLAPALAEGVRKFDCPGNRAGFNYSVTVVGNQGQVSQLSVTTTHPAPEGGGVEQSVLTGLPLLLVLSENQSVATITYILGDYSFQDELGYGTLNTETTRIVNGVEQRIPTGFICHLSQ